MSSFQGATVASVTHPYLTYEIGSEKVADGIADLVQQGATAAEGLTISYNTGIPEVTDEQRAMLLNEFGMNP